MKLKKTVFKEPDRVHYYKKIECRICGKIFWRQKSVIRYQQSRGSDSSYCSKYCQIHSSKVEREFIQNGELYLRCSGCQNIKHFSNFGKSTRQGKYRRWCKNCDKTDRKRRSERQKQYMKSYRYSANARWHSLKNANRPVNQRLEFTLDQDDFIRWFSKQKLECVYCGVTEDDYGRPLGIDRKDSGKQYNIGNMCLSCRRCNVAKSDLFTHEQFKEIANKYIKTD